VRTLFLACVLALSCAATAVAKPTVRPGVTFFAATPRASAPVVLRDRPGGRALASLGTRTQFGSPETVGVAVLRGNWVGVITTNLPNGVLGWVPRKELALTPVAWAINVSLSRHLLVLRHDGKVVHTARIAIGAHSSPTPTGRYVITDHIDPGAQRGTYGCCILALSGHQPHPPAGWSRNQDWRLAIHGGGGIGSDVSAGCLHADEGTLRLLMRLTPLGTPVTIAR
jgi:L,D-transpeptidase catalytic domain